MCLDSDRGRKMMLLDEDLDRTPQLYQLYAGGESRQAVMGRPGEIEGTSTYQPSALASSPDLSFPWRLSTMLTDSEKSPGGFQHIVSWINDGMAFKVHNRPEFTKKILPAYFKMTKYSSFTRQLHAYSFACARKGESRGGYGHPEFRRDNPSGCYNIDRKVSKTSKRNNNNKRHRSVPVADLTNEASSTLTSHEMYCSSAPSQESSPRLSPLHSDAVESKYDDVDVPNPKIFAEALALARQRDSEDHTDGKNDERATNVACRPVSLSNLHQVLPTSLPFPDDSALSGIPSSKRMKQEIGGIVGSGISSALPSFPFIGKPEGETVGDGDNYQTDFAYSPALMSDLRQIPAQAVSRGVIKGPGSSPRSDMSSLIQDLPFQVRTLPESAGAGYGSLGCHRMGLLSMHSRAKPSEDPKCDQSDIEPRSIEEMVANPPESRF